MKSSKSKRRPPPPRAKMQPVADRSGGLPAHPITEPVQFLTKAEVAPLFNVTQVTIWKWCVQGVFPKGKQVGGKTQWRSDEIARWQDQRPDARVRTEQ